MPNRRKPQHLKILEGDFEKNPQRRKVVPPPVGKPVPPDNLSADSLSFWNRISSYQWVGESDGDTLLAFLQSYEIRNSTYELWQANLLDKEARLAYTTASNEFYRWSTKFAVTPMDREKLQAETADLDSKSAAREFLA